MKIAAWAILGLLALCQAVGPGDALQCNYCFSKGNDVCEATSVQTCSSLDNACGSVLFLYPLHNSFRMCMNMAVCQGYISMPNVAAICCVSVISRYKPFLKIFPL
uniref:UPAR/Ly6 domain-containing protein n=1 Tax=Gadus morhua TaxID=8049 RepID=A0A8C5AA32_GADMO